MITAVASWLKQSLSSVKMARYSGGGIVVPVVRYALVWGVDNVHQLSAIEPNQAAIFAGINHHVAGTGVAMCIHVVVALRAVDLAAQVFSVGCGLRNGAA